MAILLTKHVPQSLDAQITELERELQVRRDVYPNWTLGVNPKLKHHLAQHRLDCLESTLVLLKGLKAKQESETQTTLF